MVGFSNRRFYATFAPPLTPLPILIVNGERLRVVLAFVSVGVFFVAGLSAGLGGGSRAFRVGKVWATPVLNGGKK